MGIAGELRAYEAHLPSSPRPSDDLAPCSSPGTYRERKGQETLVFLDPSQERKETQLERAAQLLLGNAGFRGSWPQRKECATLPAADFLPKERPCGT